MPHEFEYFLQFNERLIQKARTMEWMENSFNKLKKEGALCRTMIVVAIQRKSTIDDAARILNLDESTVSDYLKKLAKRGFLNIRKKDGKLVYLPKFENGWKEGSH